MFFYLQTEGTCSEEVPFNHCSVSVLQVQTEWTPTTRMPKLVCAPIKGSDEGTSPERCNDPKRVGDVKEVEITLGESTTRALLDTGSCVSIVSQHLYAHNRSSFKIMPVVEILNI